LKRAEFVKGIGAVGLLTITNLGFAKRIFASPMPEAGEATGMKNEKRFRIDAHAHLVAMDRKNHKSFISDRQRKSLMYKYLIHKLGINSKTTDEEADIIYADNFARLVKEARYLDKAVLFAMDGRYDDSGALDPSTDMFVSNDWAIEVCRRYPDEFLLGASIHPARPDALDELDRCAASGAVCVKWIPPSQDIDPSNPKYGKFYERMKQHNLVLSSHTGYEHSLSALNQSLGDPKRLRLPLEMGLRVVAGHAGTSGWQNKVEYFPNFAAMVQEFEDLYGDTAAVTDLYRAPYRKRLLNTPVVKDRIIQGTDYPVPPQPTVWPIAIGPVESVKLQFIKNPLDRDYLAKKAAGFPEEHFLRGHDVFLSE